MAYVRDANQDVWRVDEEFSVKCPSLNDAIQIEYGDCVLRKDGTFIDFPNVIKVNIIVGYILFLDTEGLLRLWDYRNVTASTLMQNVKDFWVDEMNRLLIKDDEGIYKLFYGDITIKDFMSVCTINLREEEEIPQNCYQEYEENVVYMKIIKPEEDFLDFRWTYGNIRYISKIYDQYVRYFNVYGAILYIGLNKEGKLVGINTDLHECMILEDTIKYIRNSQTGFIAFLETGSAYLFKHENGRMIREDILINPCFPLDHRFDSNTKSARK